MKKINYLLTILSISVGSLLAQHNVGDFENLNLSVESYWDGSDMSGLHNKGIEKLFEKIFYVNEKLNTRITTGKLNRWLSTTIENNPPPLYKGRQNNIRYITQVNIKPPTFALFMSSPDNLPTSYKRYLLSSIMKTFDLFGIPIRIIFRKGNNPYVKK